MKQALSTKLLMIIDHDAPIKDLPDLAAGRIYSGDHITNASAIEVQDGYVVGLPISATVSSAVIIEAKAHALLAEAASLGIVLTIEHRKQLSVAGGHYVVDTRPVRVTQGVANDHENACTNINEAGQPGSAYPKAEPLQPHAPQLLKHLEKSLAGWQEEARRLRNDVDIVNEQLKLRKQEQDRDTWFWQGDGDDHPESMSNGMAVVIRADHLRSLISRRTRDLLFAASAKILPGKVEGALRLEFEAAFPAMPLVTFDSAGFSFERREDGIYLKTWTELLWRGWLSARLSLQAPSHVDEPSELDVEHSFSPLTNPSHTGTTGAPL